MLSPAKKKFLKNLQNTYCRLKPSKTHGVGVFAIRDIPPGVKLASPLNLRWLKFKVSELKNLDPEIIKMVDDFFVIEKNQTVYIPSCGLNSMDISFFVNNSHRPNLKVAYDSNEAVYFVTLKKIKKGEELFSSYADYDDKYKK